MGGPGSGQWPRRGSRPTCEDQHRIDLGVLLKRGVLTPGRSGTLSWSVGDRVNGSTAFTTARDSLWLSYTVTRSDGRRETIDERVIFGVSHQRLGGVRRWFLCPQCGRRCSVLYGGRLFRCRLCHRLAYESQRVTPMWRLLSQAQKHRQKLGGSGSMDELFPPKPKGMHWRTYAKHSARAERLEGRLSVLEAAFLAKAGLRI